MFKLLLILIFAFTVYADEEMNITAKRVTELNSVLKQLDETISKESLSVIKYTNYIAYKNTQKEIDNLNEEISKVSKRKDTKSQNLLKDLEKKLDLAQQQLTILNDYKELPIEDILKSENMSYPKVENPFAIITALSYLNQIKVKKDNYEESHKTLKSIAMKLEKKRVILEELYALDGTLESAEKLNKLLYELNDFNELLSIFSTTLNLYIKKSEDVVVNITNDIANQSKKLGIITLIILIFFLISFFIKLGLKKYITDNDRFYIGNKIINFINFTLILLVIAIGYIDNVTHLITLLGFVSAGLAFAMRDLFMSVLGWFVIVIGRSIVVGDRIKVSKDSLDYVGDVLDISLLRITMHEDVTLTTYMKNRRAGRIIFIPNNYIFTAMIANYTHESLKTVWDGIDITITFDSNSKKALNIARECAKKYSKGYMDITRKQLNKLRDRYNLRNTNVDPRVFAFVEQNGIRISTWYLTNAYATLMLRSNISSEILEQFLQESDIKIAYPTTTIHQYDNTKDENRMPPE